MIVPQKPEPTSKAAAEVKPPPPVEAAPPSDDSSVVSDEEEASVEEEEEDAVERGEDGRDGGLCSWSVPCDLIFRGWASWAGKVLFVRVWKASTERTERRVRGGER